MLLLELQWKMTVVLCTFIMEVAMEYSYSTVRYSTVFQLEQFSRGKTKVLPNHKTKNPISQSQLEANVYSQRQAQADQYKQYTTGFCFLLIGWQSGARFFSQSQSAAKQTKKSAKLLWLPKWNLPYYTWILKVSLNLKARSISFLLFSWNLN